MNDWQQPDLELAMWVRANHVATRYPTHCDVCCLRWPCDMWRLADDVLHLSEAWHQSPPLPPDRPGKGGEETE